MIGKREDLKEMMIAQDNEEKRGRTLLIVTVITTVIIVLIAAFFLFRIFTENPLQGSWENEDSGILLVIRGNDTMTIHLIEDGGEEILLEAAYTMDRDNKTVTIRVDEEGLMNSAEAAGYLADYSFRADMSVLNATFHYSVENNRLILSDREHGESLVFTLVE